MEGECFGYDIEALHAYRRDSRPVSVYEYSKQLFIQLKRWRGLQSRYQPYGLVNPGSLYILIWHEEAGLTVGALFV